MGTIPQRRAAGGRLESIQVLRAVAASAVVLHHFSLDYRLSGKPSSWLVRSGIGDLGAAGVDIFFVISGFIMMYSSRQAVGLQAAGVFLKKRVLRIYPLYWIASALALAIGERLHHYAGAYVAASFLLLPAWSGESFHSLLSQGWTLQFEMLFYLVFAACMLAGWVRQRLLLASGCFALLAAAGLLWPPGSAVRYLLGDDIVIEFLLGMVVATVYSGCADLLPTGGAIRHAGPVLLLLGFVGFAWSLATPGIPAPRSIDWGIPAFLLVLGAVAMRDARPPKFLIYLGNASYSIYLFHGFFRSPFGHLIGHRWATAMVPPDILLALFSCLTIAAASSAYLLIEKPMMRYLLPASQAKQLLPKSVEQPAISA